MTVAPPPTDNLQLVENIRSRQLPPRAHRKKIREAADATISEVATACGVSYFSVWAWEKPDGAIEPRLVHRIAYRKVLDALQALAQELDAAQK